MNFSEKDIRDIKARVLTGPDMGCQLIKDCDHCIMHESLNKNLLILIEEKYPFATCCFRKALYYSKLITIEVIKELLK